MFELVFIVDAELHSVCSPKARDLRMLALQLPESAMPRLWHRVSKTRIVRVSL